MAYDPETLERLRRKLLQRRFTLVESSAQTQREIVSIRGQQRVSEMEEGAQSASAEYVLTQLGDAQHREVAQIDAALARMEAGTYGECIDCGEPISLQRLEALPYALRDAACASLAEAKELGPRDLPTL